MKLREALARKAGFDPTDAAVDDGRVGVRDYPITLDKILAGWTKA